MVKLPDKVSPAVACLTIACALAIVVRPQSSARAETTDDRSPRSADVAFVADAWTTGNGSGDTIDVRFDVRAPGETAFHPIATGSFARAK